MIELKFYSVASSRKTIIKQLEEAVDTLRKDLMDTRERDDRFVTREYGKHGLSVKNIKWGQKKLFEELWPKKSK